MAEELEPFDAASYAPDAAEIVAGVAVGGLLGAIPGLSAVLARVLPEFYQRKLKRVERVIEVARSEFGMSDADIGAAIMSSEERIAFASKVFDAAAESTIEEVLTALGRTLVSGITVSDDKQLNFDILLVRALRDLQPLHIVALRRINETKTTDGTTASDIATAVQISSNLTLGLVMTLVQHGLAQGSYEGPWNLSGLGVGLVQRLQTAADA